MTEDTAKRAFALALMERPDKPFDVAFALFPDNSQTHIALHAASHWPTDPQVLDFQAEIVREPEQAGILPSKYQAAREILERARKCKDDEIYVKLMNLYCTVMGQIEKPGTPATNTTQILVNKVIMMPSPVAKEEWSRSATQHQRQLTIEGEAISARK